MTLVRFDGTETLTSTTETNLFVAQTTLKHYATKVFLNNMISTSEITVRVFDFDNNASTERLYDSQVFKNVQDITEIFIPFIPSEGGYKVTIQSVDTTSIIITWSRFEAS